MNAPKTILVDTLATIFIAGAVWLYDPWMWWIIAIYTVILLIAKSFALYSDRLPNENQKNQRGLDRLMYFLYAVNILLLGSAGWWYLAALWALIWLLTYIGKLKD